MIRFVPISIAALALTGCVTPGAGTDAQSAPTIDFSVGPCFGFCPDFALSVTPEGEGTYEGRNFVAKRGEARFIASEEDYRAFARRLAPFRPEKSVSYGYDNCDGPVATDSPSVTVTWRDPGEEPVTLNWYMGCRQPGLADNSEALYKAWEELPVDALVGADEDRQNFGRRGE
jgi:hypothetical protein